MRIVFFGSPDFAVPSLEALEAAGHEIALVVTQPPKPVGRGGALRPPAVARRAAELGRRLFQPPTLRQDAAVETLRGAGADLFTVAAYGKLLPQNVLDLPRLGCLNVHGSILPRWRGASPVQAALLAGDRETGVSIMRMEAGLDTGAVYSTRRVPIGENDDAETLGARLAREGAGLLVEVVARLARGEAVAPAPQNDAAATYCPKISREDGRVDWSSPAVALERRGRAFTPWPGLFTFRRGRRVKLSGLRAAEGSGAAGTVLSSEPRLVVAAGEGAVAIATLQAEGRRELPAAEFVRGERVTAGEVWGA